MHTFRGPKCIQTQLESIFFYVAPVSQFYWVMNPIVIIYFSTQTLSFKEKFLGFLDFRIILNGVPLPSPKMLEEAGDV